MLNDFLIASHSQSTPSIINQSLMETTESMVEQMIDKNILFLDLETTGLPRNNKYLEFPDYTDNASYDTSRILQIGWCYYERFSKQMEPLIQRIDSVIRKPEDFDQWDTVPIHGITYEKANQGITMDKILDGEFGDKLMKCDSIVSYNIEFDFNVLANEIYRTKNQKLIDKMEKLKSNGKRCVMKLSAMYLSGQGCQGNQGYLQPQSQKKVYELMFSDSIMPQHDARNDVYTMMKILEYMITHPLHNKKSGKTWDTKEEMMLKKLYEKKLSICEIAGLHERTILAIQMRIKKLGLDKSARAHETTNEKVNENPQHDNIIHNTRRRESGIKTRAQSNQH